MSNSLEKYAERMKHSGETTSIAWAAATYLDALNLLRREMLIAEVTPGPCRCGTMTANIRNQTYMCQDCKDGSDSAHDDTPDSDGCIDCNGSCMARGAVGYPCAACCTQEIKTWGDLRVGDVIQEAGGELERVTEIGSTYVFTIDGDGWIGSYAKVDKFGDRWRLLSRAINVEK